MLGPFAFKKCHDVLISVLLLAISSGTRGWSHGFLLLLDAFINKGEKQIVRSSHEGNHRSRKKVLQRENTGICLALDRAILTGGSVLVPLRDMKMF